MSNEMPLITENSIRKADDIANLEKKLTPCKVLCPVCACQDAVAPRFEFPSADETIRSRSLPQYESKVVARKGKPQAKGKQKGGYNDMKNATFGSGQTQVTSPLSLCSLGSGQVLEGHRLQDETLLLKGISNLSKAHKQTRQVAERELVSKYGLLLLEYWISKRRFERANSLQQILKLLKDTPERSNLETIICSKLQDSEYRKDVFYTPPQKYFASLDRGTISEFDMKESVSVFAEGCYYDHKRLRKDCLLLFLELESSKILKVTVSPKKEADAVTKAIESGAKSWKVVGDVERWNMDTFYKRAKQRMDKLVPFYLKAHQISGGLRVQLLTKRILFDTIPALEQFQLQQWTTCRLCFKNPPIESHIFPASLLKLCRIQQGFGFASPHGSMFTSQLFCSSCDGGPLMNGVESRFREQWYDSLLDWLLIYHSFVDGDRLYFPLPTLPAFQFCVSLFYRILLCGSFGDKLKTKVSELKRLLCMFIRRHPGDIQAWEECETQLERNGVVFGMAWLENVSPEDFGKDLAKASRLEFTAGPLFSESASDCPVWNIDGGKFLHAHLGNLQFIMTLDFSSNLDGYIDGDDDNDDDGVFGLWKCSVKRPSPFWVVQEHLPEVLYQPLRTFLQTALCTIAKASDWEKTNAIKYVNNKLASATLYDFLPSTIKFNDTFRTNVGRLHTKILLDGNAYFEEISGHSFVEIYHVQSSKFLFCVQYYDMGSLREDVARCYRLAFYWYSQKVAQKTTKHSEIQKKLIWAVLHNTDVMAYLQNL